MEEIKTSRFGKMKKFLLITTLIIAVILIALVYWRYFFVFGEGVKSGHLNYAVRKGNLFKTYEGKLIQQGIRAPVQSYEFEFSVKDKRLFEILERNSGKIFDLHYKEYHNPVPWRGNTVYIVDSILSMRESP